MSALRQELTAARSHVTTAEQVGAAWRVFVFPYAVPRTDQCQAHVSHTARLSCQNAQHARKKTALLEADLQKERELRSALEAEQARQPRAAAAETAELERLRRKVGLARVHCHPRA